MQKRTFKVALLAVLSIVLVLGISTVGLAAAPWTDLPDTVTAKYGITDNQVAGISEGYPNGLWKPYQAVTRAQFTKMTVAAFNIPMADPATASFTDVPKGSYYYPYVEGAKAAGIVNGTSATVFGLNSNITRQQAVAIVARYIADVQGFDLATMYTADELAILLAHFGDQASIAADFKEEVAFAYDMGLTTGDDFGNFNPLANLTRIQAAAFLIRAQGLVPPNLWVPAKIELVSADKTEGLIGQVYSATFEVTTADGHPAIGVLVDLDALTGAEFYVGQVSPEAAVTNNYGQVTVNMLSLEPGTQRLAATVQGVGTIYTTRYWLVLDEVYNTKGAAAQNNAGVEHEWCVRVVVFGPGPRSTQQGDWYNAIDADFDPTNINIYDGVDAGDYWDAAYEASLAKGHIENPAWPALTPRTLAGIDVEWAIYNRVDDPKTLLTNEAVTSVGLITKLDGVAVTPVDHLVGKTNASGLSCITVMSEKIGTTLTEAIADYPENPYPEQLFNHETFQDNQWHDLDWDDQPVAFAAEWLNGAWWAPQQQVKTWISHTIGTPAGPITAAYQAANIGEEKTLTITLTDTYGNPAAGKYVEWTMQGVGFFNTDDAGDSYDPDVAANNVDYDTTNAAGKATVFVKSYDSGEQIVHAKVRDKGTGGAEGTFVTYTAEVQWFDADIVTFDDIKTQSVWVDKFTDVGPPADNFWDPQNEAVSKNPVNTTHNFCLWVYGLKLEYAPSIDYPDGQTWLIDSDATGASYDGVFDSKDAAYFNGILMAPTVMFDDEAIMNQANRIIYYDQWIEKMIDPWGYETRWYDPVAKTYVYNPPFAFLALPYDWDGDGVIEARASRPDNPSWGMTGWDERGTLEAKVAGKWIKLSFEGAFTQYDYDQDPAKEAFVGVGGIYLPLAGKSVTFTKPASIVGNVGTITPPATAVTDAAGKACVDVASTAKGLETILGTVTWKGNPHNGPELLNAYAKKTWTAGVGAETAVDVEVFIDDVLVCSTKANAVLGQPSKAMWTYVPGPDGFVRELNSASVEVHVTDAYGNDLPDYEVVYLLESIDDWLGSSQQAVSTRIPFAYLTDVDFYDTISSVDYDTNGPAPDSDEPTPQSDPYGVIVGPGGTEAFYFNQWLGSEKRTLEGQPGVRSWYTRVAGLPFGMYKSSAHDVFERIVFPFWGDLDGLFDGFDGIADDDYNPIDRDPDVGLATDGAKAWTLDGFYLPGDSLVPVANKLTGSHVDIQLAESDEAYDDADHYTSIIRVMVYAPANGLVEEGEYIFSCQAHQNWAVPEPTTITFDRATDYAIAGLEGETYTVVVKDQFGNPVPGVEVHFSSVITEGTDLDAFTNAQRTTDMFGQATVGHSPNSNQLGDWGVEVVTASLVADPGATDVKATQIKQWILVDTGTLYGGPIGENVQDLPLQYTPAPLVLQEYLRARNGEQQIRVSEGYVGWDGMNLAVYLNPAGDIIGSLGDQRYDDARQIFITTDTLTWVTGQAYFVNAPASKNNDGIVNWVYDLVLPPAIP